MQRLEDIDICIFQLSQIKRDCPFETASLTLHNMYHAVTLF